MKLAKGNAYELAVRMGYKGVAKRDQLVKCLTHADNGESLNISDGEQGRPILKCFAGCTDQKSGSIRLIEEVIKQGFWSEEPREEMHFVEGYDARTGRFWLKMPQPGYSVTEIYPRYDRETRSEILAFKVRTKPKDFRWMQPKDGETGKWVSKKPTSGQDLAPFYYPEVYSEMQERVLHWPEGEKDAITLREHYGYAAFSFGGTNDTIAEWFLNELIGKRGVIVWIDNDAAGLKSATSRCLMLHSRGIKVWLAKSNIGKDITNWKEAGASKETINEYLKSLPQWLPPSESIKGAVASGAMPNMPYDIGSEAFAGEYFAHKHKDKVKMILPEGEFYAFSGKVWGKDEGNWHRELIKGLCVTLRKDATQFSIDQRPALEKLAEKVQTDSGIRAITSMSKSVPGLHANKSEMDSATTRHLFNCMDGVFDIKTKIMLAHSPTFLLTRSTSASCKRGVQPQRFLKFMSDIFDGDQVIVEYMLDYLGYCMTGETLFQKFQVWTGARGTGKSTLQKIMRAVLGEYVVDIDSQSLRETRLRTAGTDSDLARAGGRRVTFASELSAKYSLDENLIKAITGGDGVPVKGMRENKYMLRADAKLIFTCNEMPPFSDDDGFARRFMEVQFNHKFDEHKTGDIKDYHALIIKEELDQIVGLLLDRAAKGYACDWTNLDNIPEKIQGWTQDVIEDANDFIRWYEDRCMAFTGNFVSSSELYKDWEQYCKDERIPCELTIKAFGRRIKKLGYKQDRRTSERGWTGLILRVRASA